MEDEAGHLYRSPTHRTAIPRDPHSRNTSNVRGEASGHDYDGDGRYANTIVRCATILADRGYSGSGMLDVLRDQSTSISADELLHHVMVRQSISRANVETQNGFEKAQQQQRNGGNGRPHKLPWRLRIKHVTWAYFTLTMSTGGIANVVSRVPLRFDGLDTIGAIFFLLNMFFYLVIWAMTLARFWLYPNAFLDSLKHPTESLFVPAFAVSFGIILVNIVEYGAHKVGPWLLKPLLIMFWFNTVLAIVLSITIYMILWSTTTFTIDRMTPIWIFPAYPLLIIGPHAANISSVLPNPAHALQVIVGGFTVQGVGFLVGLTIYSAFVYRLMTNKLPDERLRPGMFVSVGPAAFTASGTIGMARNLHRIVAALEVYQGVPGALAAVILQLVAYWMSLWLWGLALWFFAIALVSNVQCFEAKHRVPFAMTWFSFVFPQTALCTATFAVADAFNSYALRVIGCVMTCLLIIVWFFVMIMMCRAIWRHDILWPEKGEDKAEGGFRPRAET